MTLHYTDVATRLPAQDLERARAFYNKALAPLGIGIVMEATAEQTGGAAYLGYGEGFKPYFWLGEDKVATERLHVAFAADSRAKVDAFYKAAPNKKGAYEWWVENVSFPAKAGTFQLPAKAVDAGHGHAH